MRFLIFALFLISTFANSQTSWTNNFNKELNFIENKGQFDGRNWQKSSKIEYAIDANTFYVFFTKEGLSYRFDKIIRNPNRDKSVHDSPKRTNISELVNVSWLGANKNVEIIAENINSENYYSYAIKNFETKDVRNENHVNGYKKLTYKNLYNNIDVEYTIHPKEGIKYSIILHPGADISQIKMKYTSNHTKIGSENIIFGLNEKGEFTIKTSLGEITEHKPFTFYDNTNSEIKSKFKFENNILSFDLENYNKTKTVVIDPWIVSASFNSSTAVWELETDASGNVYVIGGETPMKLQKYNSAGTLQWTYTTPWDTASVWLGTLATDAGGTSFITSGTKPEMERISSAGAMVWHQGAGAFTSDEYWSITFNCDKTKLIVGGTHVPNIMGFDYYASIFDIDPANGSVMGRVDLASTNISGIGTMPEEVRSISSSADAKYIFLTHKQVGAINQNIGSCPNDVPVFIVDNGVHLGYKCENYLPATQNGGGLKALIANDNFFYTHTGDEIRKWDLNNGALLTTVALPGGNSSIPFMSDLVVENSGLAVDASGNVYAGSGDRVVKFDANLNIIQQANTTFTVYDVSVNNNGEVIACGAQADNQATNRNGKIEAINMSAAAQFTLVCCDVNICPVDPVCDDDPAFNVGVSSSGGTFSGTGITDATNGTFDPSTAGVGTHTITYTKPCGSETIEIIVSACEPIEVCTDGTNYIASGGTGTLTWYDWETFSYSIDNEQECIDCPTATPEYTLGFYTGCSSNTCSGTDWVQIGTGTTLNPSLINSWPIMVSDGTTQVTYNNATEIPSCSPCTAPTLSETHVNVTCSGGNDGSINLTVTPGSGSSYTYNWSGPSGFHSTSEDVSTLISGSYSVTVTDASNSACTATLTIVINDGAPTDDASFTFNDYCFGSTNSATITGTTGGTFSFNPTPTNGETINATTGSITGGIAGNTYTIEYTTDGTCPASSTQTVTVNPNPTPTITGSLTFCTGSSTTLDAGSGYTSYTWSPSGNTQTISANTAGTYAVTVIDNNGCTGSTSVNVSEASSLSPIISGNLSICSGAATTLDAGAGYFSYVWSPTGNTQTISATTSGTYSVTVSDASGCTGTDQVTVTANSNPIPTITGSLTFCTGSSTTLDAGSGYANYAWTPSYSTQTINVNTAGTYTVTVTDNNGCTGSTSANVTISSGLTPSITGILSICSGSSTTLDAGAGYTSYTWSPTGNTQTISATTSGTYAVTVSDASGCTGTDQVTVNVSTNPIPNITGTLSVCAGNTSVLDAGSGFSTYLWNQGGVSTQTITANTSGTYAVTVTNADGCTGTDQVTFTINNNPTPVISGNLVICQGNSTTLDAGTGYSTYLWSTGESSQTINVSTASNYSVTVTNSTGCTGTANVNVTVVNGVTVNISGDLSICAGDVTTLDAGSGFANYIWNTSATSQTIDVATSGNYSVTVSDNNGCSATDAVTVDVSSLTLITSGDKLICDGETTTISAALSGGGVAPYTYTWNTGETTSDITVNPTVETIYNVFVTDAMGCKSNTEIVTISIIPKVNLEIFANNDTVCPGDPVLITSLVTNGRPPYTITNEQGNIVSANNTVYPFQSETYSYTVTDGCNSTDNDIITIYTYPVPLLNIQADVLYGCEPLLVNFLVPESSNNYIYQWSFIGNNTNDASYGATTTHVFENYGVYDVAVSVVSDDGCKNSLVVTDLINVYRKPEAHFTTNPQTASIINPQINFTNLSQWANYYTWSFGDGDSSNIVNPYHSYSEINTYIVQLIAITDQGCLDSVYQTVEIAEEPTIYVPSAFSPDGDNINDFFEIKANGMDLDNFNVKVYDRWGEIIFESSDLYKSWDGKAKNNVNFVEIGSYIWLVTVKDNNGIEFQKSGTVTVIR